MLLRLLKAARINYNAGEIVEVSPAQASFLLSIGAAVEVRKTAETEVRKPTTRKGTKK